MVKFQRNITKTLKFSRELASDQYAVNYFLIVSNRQFLGAHVHVSNVCYSVSNMIFQLIVVYGRDSLKSETYKVSH